VGGVRPLAGSLIFSMGCHGGLSVSDVAVGTLDADWAQAFAAQGAAGYAANTGFGYGDSAVVAFSEELMRLFAERLAQAPTIGSAMTAAKQRYVSDLAVISPFEEKVSSQVVFYGLPMYRVAGAEPPQPEAFEVPVPDAISGIEAASVHVELTQAATSTDAGVYYSVNGEVQATPYQPVQPRSSTDVTAANRIARGALITGLVSDDVPGLLDPVVVTPTDDATAPSAEAPSRGALFPSLLQSVSRVSDVGGERDRLVVVSGQFRGDAADPAGRGVQRLFPELDAQVFYAPPGNTDTAPPRIVSTRAVVVDGEVAIEVDVGDGDVARVLALYVERDAPDPKTWRTLELVPTDGDSWFGTDIAAAGATELDYFVQVLDQGGNVSVSSDKGSNFTAGPPPDVEPEPGDPTITLDPPSPPIGAFYTGPVQVGAVPFSEGQTVELTVNGTVTTNPVVLTASGAYSISALAPGRSPVTAFIVIDDTGSAPQVSATVTPTPNAAGWNRTPVNVSIAATPGSRPVARVEYTINGGATTSLAGSAASVGLTDEGQHLVSYRAFDNTGLGSTVGTVTVKIDRTPPAVVCPAAPTFVLNQPGRTVTATVSGALANGPLVLAAPTNAVGTRSATTPAVVDQAGNSTPVSCPYKVVYRVEGFFEPITMNVVNKASAGKNVPVKWRLTDHAGQGVANVASFAALVLTQSTCSSSAGSDDIELYSSTTSTVPQYLGGGNWQLNWKTAKNLAGKCGVLRVTFDDGSKIEATFNFK
jgi:hypothetical protein